MRALRLQQTHYLIIIPCLPCLLPCTNSAIFESGLTYNPLSAAVTVALDTAMLSNGLFLTNSFLHSGCSKSRNSSNSASFSLAWVQSKYQDILGCGLMPVVRSKLCICRMNRKGRLDGTYCNNMSCCMASYVTC